MNFFLQVLVVATGAGGAVLNIYKKKVCFIIWTLHQIGWVLLALQNGNHLVILSPVMFTALNVYGWIKWRKDEFTSSSKKIT